MPYGYIYLVTNSANGKVYVGQTTASVSRRWTQHCCDAKCGRLSMPITRAIVKYGLAKFVIEEIGTADSKATLDQLEVATIASMMSADPRFGYNLSLGGRSLTAEEKRTRGEKRRGIPRSNETKIKISRSHIGIRPSADVRKRISESLRGRPIPQSVKEKISAATRGVKHCPMSADTRAKLSSAKTGTFPTPEHRKKNSDAVRAWWAKRKIEAAQ